MCAPVLKWHVTHSYMCAPVLKWHVKHSYTHALVSKRPVGHGHMGALWPGKSGGRTFAAGQSRAPTGDWSPPGQTPAARGGGGTVGWGVGGSVLVGLGWREAGG
eukprot:scaffold26567_cov80-Isochrysis_galbana.AAC.1